ncbi:MAG: deoxyribonuclease IV [Planctomycetota bacterium]|nr:deoxyribonuclease IV [Planctomycetota bacterium]
MFGSHLSIAGTMVNALDEGERLGLDCVQVFTKNQQQWKAKPLDPGMVRDWHARVAELGWGRGGPDGRGGIVSHASYLINLASVKDELWAKSVDLMTDEIERCEALGIPYLVHHPGSHVGGSFEDGMARIEKAYAEVFSRTAGFRTVSCFEGTVGGGSSIGGKLEHLRDLLSRCAGATGRPERLGVCLDTCHLHAAGYDLSTRAQGEAVLAEVDRVVGLSRVRVLHVNDSKGRAGSKLDRHEHIGEGWIGGTVKAHAGKGTYSVTRLRASGFASFMGCPAFRGVPKILETPKVNDSRGRAYDLTNLRRLRLLVGAAPTRPGAGSHGSAAKPAIRAGL